MTKFLMIVIFILLLPEIIFLLYYLVIYWLVFLGICKSGKRRKDDKGRMDRDS